MYVAEDTLYDNLCVTKAATICVACYDCTWESFKPVCNAACSPDDNKYCLITDNSGDGDKPWNFTCRSGYLNVILHTEHHSTQSS